MARWNLPSNRSEYVPRGDSITAKSFFRSRQIRVKCIEDRGNDVFRYYLSGGFNIEDLYLFGVVKFVECANSKNNGEFPIVSIFRTLFCVDVKNVDGVAQEDVAGYLSLNEDGRALNVHLDSSTDSVRIGNGNETLEVDPLGAICTLNLEQAMIHRGNQYILYKELTLDAGANNAGNILIVAPNTSSRVYLRAYLQANNSGKARLREAIITSSDGISLAVYNNDRNSENISKCLLFKNPIVSDKGTPISGFVVGAGGSEFTGFLGNSGEGSELILKQGTKYLIRFIADNDATTIAIRLHFYEV